MLRVLFLIVVIFSCSGCIVGKALDSAGRTLSSVSITTETFSDVSQLSPQRTILVVLSQDQENNLEAQSYLESINSHLQEYGFVLVDEVADADLAAAFTYSISGPYQTTEGGDEGVSLYVKYKRLFSLAIVDAASFSSTGEVSTVYQSGATSLGGQKSFNVVSECLIKATFKHFPDENGKVRRQSFGAPGCMK